MITTQRCNTGKRARAQLRKGTSVANDAGQLAVTVSDDEVPTVWAVGTADDEQLQVTEGVGAVPFAAEDDALADKQPIAWFPGYMLEVNAVFDGSALAGTFALAVDPDQVMPELSSAVARTMTVAKQLEPNCPPTCSEPSLGSFLYAFDVNKDGTYTAEEVEEAGVIEELGFYRQLDLLTLSRTGEVLVWPNHDGMPDTFGHAYGFTAAEVEVR